MAEGDSIHRLARRLDSRLKDARVTTAQARTSRIDPRPLIGLTVKEVRPLGKHLLMRFEGDRELTLHSHLRVQGQWTIIGAGKHLPRKVDELVRLKLGLDDGRTAIAINMPVLELVETKRESDIIGYVGPDIMADDFDVESAADRLQRNPHRPAVAALLDQRNVSGPGNVWVIEMLFLRGVHPDQPIGDVDTKAMLQLARKMMLYSRDVQKGMITTGIKGHGKTHWVYGRAGKPCHRCKTPIQMRRATGRPYERETWWCPHCQPLKTRLPLDHEQQLPASQRGE
jgi:endonuclease VIII